MQKKDFLNYIHYFRGLAILFIVGLHAAVILNWGERVDQRKALIVLFNNGTVLFVFIAGFLFYYLNQYKFDYKDYLKKKFLYVIIPYLLISIPAILDKFYFDKVGDHWWMTDSYHELPLPLKVISLLATGRHMGIFWFIPMISVIYIAAPLILKFSKTRAFLFITPVLVLLSLFVFRFGYYANIGLSLIYFFPIYLFGVWACRLRDKMFVHARLWAFAFVGTYFVISLCEFMEWLPFNETIGLRDVHENIYRFNVNKFKMVLFCIGGLSGLYLLQHVKIGFLKLLGDYSFGIFFIHLYILQVFRILDRGRYLRISPPNMITFVLYFIVVVALTLAIVKVLKLCFKQNSRYVIGS